MAEVPMEEVQEHIHHEAHGARESWIGAVAVCTAFMATFAAISALLSSKTGEESLKEHTAAFNQWNYFQAKSIKASILENKIDMLKMLDKTPPEKDLKKAEEYRADQEKIKHDAEELEKISKLHGDCKENFEFAVTMFQVSIAIAAISVLTRRKAFWFVSLAFAAVGITFLVIGYTSMPKHESHGETHEKAAETKH